MPTLIAPPPTRITSSKPISQSSALSLLQNYLQASLTDPSLHPDSYLSPEGPQFSTAGPDGGITMTQLRRLEAGLRGERVLGGMDAEKFERRKGGIVEKAGDANVLGGLGAEGFVGSGAQEEAGVEIEREYEDAIDPEAYALAQESDESAVESDGNVAATGGRGAKIPGRSNKSSSSTSITAAKKTKKDERVLANGSSATSHEKWKNGAGAERVGGDAGEEVTVDVETVKLADAKPRTSAKVGRDVRERDRNDGVLDKEARKKVKKARRKEEKKERGEKRRKME